VLIDTARYATFYCGNKDQRDASRTRKTSASQVSVGGSLPAAYSKFHVDEKSEMLIEVPEAQGADIYIFAGPDLRLAVQRYNLFSGGGALPPRWGLGFWYRCDLDFTQTDVLALADQFRRDDVPCDVLGLEPGWQTHSYSCSYVWSDKFPNPAEMLTRLAGSGYHLNLWEHAFTHPTSPLYQELKPLSGDFEVWDGLVPDFLDARARERFAAFHEREHVKLGVSGYKLDECDNSDFTGNWSFPEISRFPSGADGEQMHCLFGRSYQDTLQSIFDQRKTRTYQLVRSSGALAAPYPFVLYSDLYDHSEFIRGLANSSFSGLLWCPEVRDARDGEDLIRRLQTVVFSPLAMVNAWYIKHPPWKQVDAKKNNAGEFAPDWEHVEAACRELIRLRMRLLPYFHAAFVRYHREGLAPFRSVVMDYPADPETWTIDDQYMAGDFLLVAPVVAGIHERQVYLPAGDWFDFWTGKKLAGNVKMTIPVSLETIPVYVKDGSMLPLAEATPHAADPRAFDLEVRVYGSAIRGSVLFEEDGSFDPKLTRAHLLWDGSTRTGRIERNGPVGEPAYQVRQWTQINGT
jgi:alpha-D-xyloside xylohydrolase